MMTTKSELAAEDGMEAVDARKPWVMPVVEMHDVEDLTMASGGVGGDGPSSSAS